MWLEGELWRALHVIVNILNVIGCISRSQWRDWQRGIVVSW